jgi:ribosome biogenesis GTPase
VAEEPALDPFPSGEPDRQGGRRLSRARRPDAEIIWREGYSDDAVGGIQRRKDQFRSHGKIKVDKLPDVAGDPLNGVVVSVSRRTAEVEILEGERTGETILCSYSPRLVLGRESLVAVGDRAAIHPMPGSGWLLTSLEPRRTRLSRPGPDARDHLDIVVAANLDVLVIVVSVDRPRFHPRFVDRFLVAAQMGGVEPALFLNKCDLPDAEPDLDTYRRLGVPVFRGSAHQREGLDDLRQFLSGKWSAFAGISGVGKSSLVRTLIPGSKAEIGEVRGKDGRGRHTTTRAQVYRLSDDSRIVDTPGIRELAMHRLTAQEVQLYFTEFDAYFGTCRFNDCVHSHEPGCAVAKAVEDGAIHPDRYASYRRILESLQ